MTANASELPGQEAAPFSLTMEVEEDVELEIETFVRFKRRGEYERAEEIFQQTLSAHLSLFPVIAEYADLLLVQEKYRMLSEFLDIQIQYMEPVLEEEEVELLRIMRSLAHLYTEGSLRSALKQAKASWDYMYSRSTKIPFGTLPGDVEIHIFELYIRIMVFALKNSNWVTLDKMKCPWALEESPHCGFVRWYSILSSNGHIWSASQVLVLLLEALPLFSSLDGSVLFDKHCFGEIPSEEALCEFRELDWVIACSVSFSRAQALLDLTLILYPNNDKWRGIFEVALGYHQAAKFLTTITSRHDMRSLPCFKCYVQGIQFERVQETLINQGPADSFLPVSHPMKWMTQIWDLIQVLEGRFRDSLQNIISGKKSAFGQFADLRLLVPGSFDIPAYIRAVHTIQKTLAVQPCESRQELLLSNSYFEEKIKVLLEPVSMISLSELVELADLVLVKTRKSIGADESATEIKQIATDQAGKLSHDPSFTRKSPTPNIDAAMEAGAKHGGALAESSIKASSQLPGEAFSNLQNSIQSPLTGNYSARDQTQKTAKESANDEVSISYIEFCKGLRADLKKCFEQCDRTTPKFAPRGTAETLLRGLKLLQFFNCLSLPEVAIQALDPPYEETLARRLSEKRLHDFLAILIYSECEIEAVQHFVINLLVRESWAAERCSLPTSGETLMELFEDTIATDKFLTQQAIFCPAVLVVGMEVLIPNVEGRRLPYVKEQIIGKGSFGTVFKTAIAEGHIHDPYFNDFTRWTTQVARKDFNIRTDLESRRSTAAHEIMTTILSLRKENDNVLTSLGAFCIGSLTYSLFMPLATYNLGQYMMVSQPMRPDSRNQRVAFIKNAQGLANGLDFLHTRLKTKEGDDLVCYHVDLKPENILLIFSEKTPGDDICTWKISDFAMSYVKYRRQGEEQGTVIDLRSRFTRNLEQNSQDSPASRAEGRLGEATCLAPECMETFPIISTSSDVWSLGCVISIVFTYLDDGAQGVTKYAAKRAAHSKANGCDRFFIRGRNNPRPHPAIKTWHSQLIKRAKNRSRGEGKEVELILRFLENDVFQEQSKRCDARSLEQKLSKALGTYEELELSIDQGRHSR
ncbi:uncharacterized protein N7473_006489 [Penicillium subrubescens]|uniref:uncharacterized protein n=1 Tax=Penicillium subrubescens TaxID=1316194 RepID=UPI0025453C07|nr:uncharacterized protein N7473_006489 [Penicillium subrubescens]KAJ5897090.1 hypothetical protein N7473_006489 [Penicillium subrubescens]